MLSWLQNCCRPALNQFFQRKEELMGLVLAPTAKKRKIEITEIKVEKDVNGNELIELCEDD